MDDSPDGARLSEVARDTLARRVADQLTSAIRSGRFSPGTRLVESDLAEQLSTSRGPVREALRQLTEAGLVEILPHRGAIVAQPAPSELAGMLALRALIEGMAARMVVMHQESATYGQLRGIVDAMSRTIEPPDLPGVEELHWRFHEILVEGARLPLLHVMWLRARYRLGLLIFAESPAHPQPSQVLSQHAELLRIIETASPGEAERQIRRNLVSWGFRRWMRSEVPDGLLDGLDA